MGIISRFVKKCEGLDKRLRKHFWYYFGPPKKKYKSRTVIIVAHKVSLRESYKAP